MLDLISNFLLEADAIFWGYAAFIMILFLGIYFTFITRFFQLRSLSYVLRTFFQEIFHKNTNKRGVHPLKTFFASAGGIIGVANIVGVVTAIQIGGPGALLWVWVAGFAGTLIKYAEVYLGFKHRIQNGQNSYDGGPMYFLRKAFGFKSISTIVCVLLCVYGCEIYQFHVIVDTLATSWNVNRVFLSLFLLGLIIYAGIGGVSRVTEVCSWIMPSFMFIYITMCFWIIGSYWADIPALMGVVFKSAFTGHAALGGFTGSTMLLAIQNGMAGACYSADIGIGYDAIVQSESHTVHPERQAGMAILGVIMDNFICTLSILVVLVTGLWQTPLGHQSSSLVQMAFEQHFPYVNLIMPFFIFILGYTTLLAYFVVGLKCACFIFPKAGTAIYILYTCVMLILFAFLDQTIALLVMRLDGALLLIINIAGIYLLRKDVVFAQQEQEMSQETSQEMTEEIPSDTILAQAF